MRFKKNKQTDDEEEEIGGDYSEESNDESDDESNEDDESDDEEVEEEEEIKPKKKKVKLVSPTTSTPVKSKQTYAMFDIPPRRGIVNTETEEIIAGGENADEAILQALANMKGQLERIENMIGSILTE